MVIILVMFTKKTTLGHLKVKVFRNKDNDVISYAHDVTKKVYHVSQIILQIYSCDQSLVTLPFI